MRIITIFLFSVMSLSANSESVDKVKLSRITATPDGKVLIWSPDFGNGGDPDCLGIVRGFDLTEVGGQAMFSIFLSAYASGEYVGFKTNGCIVALGTNIPKIVNADILK